MRLLKESCLCSFSKELKKMAYFCENLGIINKVWYLLCSLENNYLWEFIFSFTNDIIQGE